MANIQLRTYSYRYPHPAVTTDCVILTFHEDRLKILLIRRGVAPFKGKWALPGGFMRIDESAEECALRELREETGVGGCHIRQFHTFTAPGRDPRERVVTIAFYALMKWQKAEGADDAEYAGWVPMDNLPKLAFDHEEIIHRAMEAIRRDIFFEPIGFELLDDFFSMPQLQKVYEAILGRNFDRRNFAKKMKHLGIIDSVDDEAEAILNEDVALPERESSMIMQSELDCCSCDLDASSGFKPFEESNIALSRRYGEPDRRPPMMNEAPPESIFSVIDRANRRPKTRQKGRLGKLFKWNKEKYDDLKNNNFLEF